MHSIIVWSDIYPKYEERMLAMEEAVHSWFDFWNQHPECEWTF